MSGEPVSIRPFGEAALLVVLGESTGIGEARRARALGRAVEAIRAADPRWGSPTPAAASVLVPFDATTMEDGEVRAVLARLAAELPDEPPADSGAREIVVPVRYGGEHGPDLADVARELSVTEDGIVEAHVAADHEVLFLGFAPGFPYIAGLPDWLTVSRLATPRVRVAAGSVGIAGRLSGIYPHASPGGWRIVGRTDLRIFDPAAAEPALLRPGDRVRFVPR